jgi:hypothetical protein
MGEDPDSLEIEWILEKEDSHLLHDYSKTNVMIYG